MIKPRNEGFSACILLLALASCSVEALSAGDGWHRRVVPFSHLRLRGGGRAPRGPSAGDVGGGEGKREREGRGGSSAGRLDAGDKRAKSSASPGDGASQKHYSLFQRLMGQEGGGGGKEAGAVMAEMEEEYSPRMLADWKAYVDEALSPLAKNAADSAPTLKVLHEAQSKLYAHQGKGGLLEMALAGWARLARMLAPGGEAWAAVHHSLGAAYHDRFEGNATENIDDAAKHLNQALGVYEGGRFPDQWARTHQKLASVYVQAMSLEGPDGQGGYADKALKHLTLSLRVYTRETHPEHFGRVQQEAGNIYMNRSDDRTPKSDAEMAGDCYSAALQVFSKEAFPREFAECNSGIARSLLGRRRGDRAGLCDKACLHLAAAAEIYGVIGDNQGVAATHCGMAAALRSVVMQPGIANREESRAKAIFHYGEALKVYAANTHPRSHADAHLCMAEARLEGLRGRPTPEVCKAIVGHYSTALSICNMSNDTERVAQCHTSAARACMTVRNSSQSLGVGDAVEHLRAALDIYTMEGTPADWADAQAALSEALCARGGRDGGKDVEDALVCISNALKVTNATAAPAAWGGCVFRKAVCLVLLKTRDRSENLEQAMALCKDAIAVFSADRFPEMRGRAHQLLGEIYMSRMEGDRSDNLEQAVACGWKALHGIFRDDNVELWAATHSNLADAYLARIEGERPKNVFQAIEHCRQALYVYTCQDHALAWAHVNDILARAYLERDWDGSKQEENLDLAIQHWTTSLKVYTCHGNPAEYTRIHTQLGFVYSNRTKPSRLRDALKTIHHFNCALAPQGGVGGEDMWGMHLGLAEAYDAFGQGRKSARMVLNHSEQALSNLPEQERTVALRASLYLMMGVAEWRLMRGGRGEEQRRQRAIAHLRESLNLSREEPTFSQASLVLAGILRKRGGSGASAEHAWNEAILLYKGALCEVDAHGSARDRATVWRRLGELYSRMGRHGLAIAIFEEARNVLVERHGEDDGDVARLDRLLGWAFAGPGNGTDAERFGIGGEKEGGGMDEEEEEEGGDEEVAVAAGGKGKKTSVPETRERGRKIAVKDVEVGTKDEEGGLGGRGDGSGASASGGSIDCMVSGPERLDRAIHHLTVALGGGGGGRGRGRAMRQRLGELLELRSQAADGDQGEGQCDLKRAWWAFVEGMRGSRDRDFSRKMLEAVLRLWRGGLRVQRGVEQTLESLERLIAYEKEDAARDKTAADRGKLALLYAEAASVAWGILMDPCSTAARPRDVCRKAASHSKSALSLGGGSEEGFADLVNGDANRTRSGATPGYVELCMIAGRALLTLGKEEEAREWHERALLGVESKGGDDDGVPTRAQVVRGLAVIMLRTCKDGRGGVEDAIRLCEQGIQQTQDGEKDAIDRASIHMTLGRAYFRLATGKRAHNLARAIEFFEKASAALLEGGGGIQSALSQCCIAAACEDPVWEIIDKEEEEGMGLPRWMYEEPPVRMQDEEAEKGEDEEDIRELNENLMVENMRDSIAERLRERAITCYEDALRLFDSSRYPTLHAELRARLGQAYARRKFGFPPSNFGLAIDHYKAASDGDGPLAAIAANNAACLIVKRSTLRSAGDFWESGEAFERSSDMSCDDEERSYAEYGSHEDGEEDEGEMRVEKVQYSRRSLDLQEATRLFTSANEWFKERGREKERFVISGNIDSISSDKFYKNLGVSWIYSECSMLPLPSAFDASSLPFDPPEMSLAYPLPNDCLAEEDDDDIWMAQSLARKRPDLFIKSIEDAEAVERLSLSYYVQRSNREGLNEWERELTMERENELWMQRMVVAPNPEDRFDGLNEVHNELWRRGLILCDPEQGEERCDMIRLVLAKERSVELDDVPVIEIEEMERAGMLRLVRLAAQCVGDADRQANAMALVACRSAVEYGDDAVLDGLRAVLLKRYPTNDTDSGDDLEKRVDGMEAMLNWDQDLVEAAKEKGGVVAILEKQLAVQEEEEEAAKRLTERGGLPGSTGIRSEVIQGVQRRQLLQQPTRVPSNDEIKESARHLKEVNPTYGARRIWNAMKEEHPDWTVPEGRVNRLMVEMRQAALNEEVERGHADGEEEDGEEGAGVSEETSEISAAKDEKSEEVDSDEPVILDRHKELMAVYQDPIFEHLPGGGARLNETEVPYRVHGMSRKAELLFRRSYMAACRGVASSEVSMSEVSQIEREEEEKLARIEEDAAEGDDDDDGSSGSSDDGMGANTKLKRIVAGGDEPGMQLARQGKRQDLDDMDDTVDTVEDPDDVLRDAANPILGDTVRGEDDPF